MLAPASPLAIVPTREQVDRRLEQIIRRGSLNVGGNATMDRLMLMMTRSCELRCSYCMVALTEEGAGDDYDGRELPLAPRGDMSFDTLRAAIDLLMRSSKPRLGFQTFGGEPTRRFAHLLELLDYALAHPRRAGRPVEFLLTTNGLGLTAERVAALDRPGVVVELSLDGDEHGNRFRRPHELAPEAAWEATSAAVDALNAGGVRWFMNATLPPSAAGELMDRYRWARATGVPALQMNYATGMAWSDQQVDTYLTGLQTMLADHHANPSGLELFNWANDADPVPLCGDIIVDVDGALLQVGALFHEKRFPALRHAYRRGHVTDAIGFDGLRFTLQGLWDATHGALTGRDLDIFASNVRLGAAADLVVRFTARQLGRERRRN